MGVYQEHMSTPLFTNDSTQLTSPSGRRITLIPRLVPFTLVCVYALAFEHGEYSPQQNIFAN